MESIFRTLDPLMEFKPPFIDVTYHREEYVYKKRPSGYFEKSSIRKRPGTVGICAAIMHRYGVDAVPHLICGGFTQEETENALIDLSFLGIDNVLALRGDARKFEQAFIPEPNGHAFAVDLVEQINTMNSGRFLDDSIVGEGTNFCVLTQQIPALRAWIAQQAAAGRRFALLGDFNRRMTLEAGPARDAAGNAANLWGVLDAADKSAADLTNIVAAQPFTKCVAGSEYSSYIDTVVVGRDLASAIADKSFVRVTYSAADAAQYRLSDHCPVGIEFRLH